MKKVLAMTFLILFGFLSLYRGAEAGEMKIAHLDLQRALNECEAGVKAKEELKKEAKKLEDELNSKQEDLKKLKDEMDKKSSLWNKETKEDKEKEFQTRSQELQKEFMRYGDDLNKKRSDREEKILKELTQVIRKYAKEKGYTFVLESSMGRVLYAPEDADITDEVIKEYNKSIKN
ncbi:MAG: OmpH family outer membrane protein [Deltaproteobacteria bacterium]|nr:OmpH family outer membrane protein [Deltaproteobacteria bacterium]